MNGFKELKFNKNYTVAMSNDFAKLPQKLSINATRIFRTILSNVQNEDKEFFPYQFKAADMAKFWEISPSALIQKRMILCEELKSFVVKYQGNEFKIFDYATYSSFRFYIKLSEQSAVFFRALRTRFLSYHLRDILKLNTSNSIRIYENVRAVDGLYRCQKSMIYLELSELKKSLALDKKYTVYHNFKNRVLVPSIRRINLYSDYRLELGYEYEDRKIKKIIFEPHVNRGSFDCHY